MAGSLLPLAKQLALDNSANPGNGYKFYTYEPGTLTPKATYQDAALTEANANPVIANARGEVTMYGDGLYRMILKDANDNTVWDRDNVGNYLSSAGGSAQIGFAQSGPGAVPRPAQDKMRESLSVKDFGAKGDGVTDDTGAIQAAINYANSVAYREVRVPAGVYNVASNLIIKEGVALVGENVARQAMPGDWINGTANQQNGTSFWTNHSAGNASGASFIRLERGSTVENINIWYTGQTKVDDPATIVAYPPTFEITTNIGAGNADNATISNCAALNCYEFLRIGDGVNPVGRPMVENCFANPFYKGVTANLMSGDVGFLRKVLIENLFTTVPNHMPNLYSHIRTNCVAFDIGNSQGFNLTDCIALAYGVGLRVETRSWIQVSNCLFDHCGLPFHAIGADRVMLSNSTFITNFLAGSPSAKVEGVINGLMFSNCFFGDNYSSIKTGIYCKHTAGTVKVASSSFRTSYPAVLNVSTGTVEMSACGIGYDRVTGKGISIDGGPVLQSGASLGLTNINPTSPAALGWSYVTPANVTAITNGIRIQGAGNNTITYRPADVSAANNNAIFYGTQMYVLEFDYKVVGQSGSPKLELLILSNSDAIAADAFQVSQDATTSDSGLPENETFRVAVILPWSGDASKIRFNLPSQVAGTSHEITNLDIKHMVVERGFTGLEFFKGKTKLPLGYFDPQTGGKVWLFPGAPVAGTWSVNDRTIHLTPAIGQPNAWKCIAAGTPGTWASEGNLA